VSTPLLDPASRTSDRLLVPALMLVAPLLMLVIVLHVLWGLVVAAALFPRVPAAVSGALVRFWSRVLMVVLGVRLEVPTGRAPPASACGALLLMNHISWADVFVLAAVTPARFVAKAEVEHWPLVGRFATAVGTVFVERGRRHSISRVNQLVSARLQGGQSIGVYPEGTTTDGTQLLRFHSNLVQAALDASAPVIPVALAYYQDERPTTAAAFIGDMTLIGSLWRILVTPRLTARLHWLAPVDCAGQTRQEIARRARSAIAQALGLPDGAPPAPGAGTDADADTDADGDADIARTARSDAYPGGESGP